MALPVIVYVPATPRPEAAAGPVAPEMIAELVAPDGEGREARYARAGVREYWRVEPDPQGAAPRVRVLTDPDREAGCFRATSTYEGQEPLRSAVLPRLVLRPADLLE